MWTQDGVVRREAEAQPAPRRGTEARPNAFNALPKEKRFEQALRNRTKLSTKRFNSSPAEHGDGFGGRGKAPYGCMTAMLLAGLRMLPLTAEWLAHWSRARYVEGAGWGKVM